MFARDFFLLSISNILYVLIFPFAEVERAVSEFIKYEISFNVYMFHGGTNFGFMNGATNFGKHTGIVTSYGKCLPVQ